MNNALEMQLEIEKLAQQLFQEDNPDPDLDWSTPVGKIVSGDSVGGGITPEVKEIYRAKAVQILQNRKERKSC